MKTMDFKKVKDPDQNRWLDESGRYSITSEHGSRYKSIGKCILRFDGGDELLIAHRFHLAVERAVEHQAVEAKRASLAKIICPTYPL